jgi:hypothetical protein
MKTTKDLIKILPLSKEFKATLLERFDSLLPYQKYRVENTLWDMYDSIYELRLQENMDLAFERAKQNKEKLDHEFYARVRKQTEMDLEKQSSTAATTVDLSNAREELEKLINQPQHHKPKTVN